MCLSVFWGRDDGDIELEPHLELIGVNLDDPQGPKYLSQVGSLIAEK